MNEGDTVLLTNWTGSANSPVWIHPDWPGDVVRGLFSFRTHGVSPQPYSSLNVGYHVSDNPDKVRQNRLICATALGGELSDWVVPEQVHGVGVAVVDETYAGQGALPASQPVHQVDALVTNRPGLALVVMSADCVPILFFDPVRHVVAAAHSGWKGTVGHIAKCVVETMTSTFGTHPSDIDIWLGPSIRRCCYEVDDTVAVPVHDAFGGGPLVRRHQSPGKYWLSLHACIRQDLLASGVARNHIHDTGVCSGCRTSVLFSHRMERGKTGRFLGAVRLVTGGNDDGQ